MTDTQLVPVRTLAQQLRDAAIKLDGKKPKPEDRAAFRAIVEREPNLWGVYGDLAYQAQALLIKSVNMPESMRESLRIGLEQMRQELANEDAPRLVKLLASNVVMCWLQLSITEYGHSQKLYIGDGVSIATADFWERRLSMAQVRYLRASETLARVKRLAIPVQINIAAEGGQQVNVAQ